MSDLGREFKSGWDVLLRHVPREIKIKLTRKKRQVERGKILITLACVAGNWVQSGWKPESPSSSCPPHTRRRDPEASPCPDLWTSCLRWWHRSTLAWHPKGHLYIGTVYCGRSKPWKNLQWQLHRRRTCSYLWSSLPVQSPYQETAFGSGGCVVHGL